MARNSQLSNEAANAAADAVTSLLDNGYLRIYDGSQPANADTSVSTQNLLAELRYGSTAFAAAVNGVATANGITSDSSANSTGTASWFRTFESDGISPVFDGSVGTSNSNLNLSSVSIVSGMEVSVTSQVYTQSKVQ